VALSYPLVLFPCRTSVHSLLFRKTYQGIGSTELVTDYIPPTRFNLITGCIIVFCLIVGILVPDIELVLGLVGSTMGSCVCVIFPATMFIKLAGKDAKETKAAKAVLAVGVATLIVGTYVNLGKANSGSNPADKLTPPKRLDMPDFVQPMPEIVPEKKSENIESNVDNQPKKVMLNNSHNEPVAKVKEDPIKEPDVARKEPPVPQEVVRDDDTGVKRQEPPIPQAPVDSILKEVEKPDPVYPLPPDEKKEDKINEILNPEVEVEKKEKIIDDILKVDTKNEEAHIDDSKGQVDGPKEPIDNPKANDVDIKRDVQEQQALPQDSVIQDKVVKSDVKREDSKRDEEDKAVAEKLIEELAKQKEESAKIIQEQKEILQELKEHQKQDKQAEEIAALVDSVKNAAIVDPLNPNKIVVVEGKPQQDLVKQVKQLVNPDPIESLVKDKVEAPLVKEIVKHEDDQIGESQLAKEAIQSVKESVLVAGESDNSLKHEDKLGIVQNVEDKDFKLDQQDKVLGETEHKNDNVVENDIDKPAAHDGEEMRNKREALERELLNKVIEKVINGKNGAPVGPVIDPKCLNDPLCGEKFHRDPVEDGLNGRDFGKFLQVGPGKRNLLSKDDNNMSYNYNYNYNSYNGSLL